MLNGAKQNPYIDSRCGQTPGAMKALRLTFCLLFLHVGVHAQYVVSKLHLARKEVLKISESDVQIDTLIMDNKSQIVFLGPVTNLVVENAFIGEKCTWDVSGKSAERIVRQEVVIEKGSFSVGGLPGRQLHAKVTFRYLGKLSIDASGATGKLGRNPSTPRVFDYDDTAGGNGGNGGIVSLRYTASGLPINFNEGTVRSIYVNVEGGRGNRAGLITVPDEKPSQVRMSQPNAPSGNQKAPTAVAPGASIAPQGGIPNLPVPVFLPANAQDAGNGSASTNPNQNFEQKPQPDHHNKMKNGGYGRRGKKGSFTYLKIEEPNP